jgi:hypothetical protein
MIERLVVCCSWLVASRDIHPMNDEPPTSSVRIGD